MSVGEWSEKLTKELENDLYVSEVTVIDDLIQDGYISSDDWNVINHINRQKKRVKILVNQLCKCVDPISAFQALATCLEKRHPHLVGVVQDCLKDFPGQDIVTTARQPDFPGQDIVTTARQPDFPGQDIVTNARQPDFPGQDIVTNARQPVEHSDYTCGEESDERTERRHRGKTESACTTYTTDCHLNGITSAKYFSNHDDDGHAQMLPLIPDTTNTGILQIHGTIAHTCSSTRCHYDLCNSNYTDCNVLNGNLVDEEPYKYAHARDETDTVLVNTNTCRNHKGCDSECSYSHAPHRHSPDTHVHLHGGCTCSNNGELEYCSKCLQLQTGLKRTRVGERKYIERLKDDSYTNKRTHVKFNDNERSQVTKESRPDSRLCVGPPNSVYIPPKCTLLESPEPIDNEKNTEKLNTHNFMHENTHNLPESQRLHDNMCLIDVNRHAISRPYDYEAHYSTTCNATSPQNRPVENMHKYQVSTVTHPNACPCPFTNSIANIVAQRYSSDCVNSGYINTNHNTSLNSQRMQNATHSIGCNEHCSDACSLESIQSVKDRTTSQQRTVEHTTPTSARGVDMAGNIPTGEPENAINPVADSKRLEYPSCTSDDEANTDICTSDFTTNERVLCNMLQRNIADFSDIVDHLIEDGYLSNDDYRVIHSNSIDREKAAFLVKCLSDSQNSEGFLECFKSCLMHLNPSLCMWLNTTFSTKNRTLTHDSIYERNNVAVEAERIGAEDIHVSEYGTHLPNELIYRPIYSRLAVENTESESEPERNARAIPVCSSDCVLGDEVDHTGWTERNDYRHGVMNERFSDRNNNSVTGNSELPISDTFDSTYIARLNNVQTFVEGRLISAHSPYTIMPQGATHAREDLGPMFDKLNALLNEGMLQIDRLPDNPDVQCIVFYLKACDCLYAANYEDVERYIALSEFIVEHTSCPDKLRSEIFTNKTWLCLKLGQLGKMEQLLRENEQYLKAHPHVWPLKARGWLYFDYGRFNKAMMETAAVLRKRSSKEIVPGRSQSARDVYKQNAIKCCEKAVDYFTRSSSSDGPIGAGFSLALMASVYLDCGCTFNNISKQIDNNDISKSDYILRACENRFKVMPSVLKGSYLVVMGDLHYRKWQLNVNDTHLVKAIYYNNENVKLCTEIDLIDELKESRHRLNVLTGLLENEQMSRIMRQRLVPSLNGHGQSIEGPQYLPIEGRTM